MSTRSNIGMDTGNGIDVIYCQFDGYPEHHGPILLNAYNKAEFVAKLLNLGDLSILRSLIGKKQDFDKPNEDWCLAYGRDRGEKEIEKRHFQSENEWFEYLKDGWVEYIYLFRNGQWWYQDTYNLAAKKWKPLEEWKKGE